MRQQKLAGKIDPQTQLARSIGYRLVGLQAIVTVIIAVLWWVFGTRNHAFGAFLGGAACFIPSLLLTWRLFRVAAKTKAAKRIAFAFFTGEFAKLFISAGLVALIVVKLPFGTMSVLSGFIGAQFSLWLAPLLINLNEEKSG